MKLRKENIDLIANNMGYGIIKYPNNYLDKIYFIDEYGYKYMSNWETFKRSKNKFKPITFNNPFSVENAKLYLINNNIPIKILSDNIDSVTNKVKFQAKCGHEMMVSWNKVKRRKYYLCDKCYQKQKGLDSRLTKEDIVKIFLSKNYTLLESPKITSYSLLCEDRNGYIGRLSYNNLMIDKTFDPFSSKNLFTINNIRHYLDINNIQLEILSKNYINCEDDMLWKCSCGNLFYKKWDYIRSGRGVHCNECWTKSNLEKQVELVLKDKEIYYIKEHKYKDCGNIKPYPFDFYIPKYNLCIEVDGEQHYKPVCFGGISKAQSIENFKKQKIRDKMKDDYCKNNNIHLLRISYIDIEHNTYKEIINQWLK